MNTMVRPRKSDTHLPRCVYRKNGAYWHVKKNKWTRLGATLDAAMEAYARLFEAPREGGMPGLIDGALADMASRKPPLSEGTLRQYRSAAKIIKRKLAEFDPGDVTSRDVVAFKRELKTTPAMANTCLALLSETFVYALEEQIDGVTGNPVLGVRRYPQNERERLILPGEYAAIYAQADPQLQVIMDLCIRTGQRIGAVLRIERANLLESGIRFGRFKTDGKGVVAWTPELRRVIERAGALTGAVRSMRWLFIGRDPSRPPSYSTVRRRWAAACKAAGIQDANLHDLRAVAATEAEGQGKDPSKLLLHASRKNTERYLRKKREPVVDGPSFDDAEKSG